LDYQLKQIDTQYYSTKKKLENKFKAEKFLVYFQSFTNTYAPLDTLKTLYSHALKLNDSIGLSIGTRADSVTEEILSFLAQLSKQHEIWIEYGIQSVHNNILDNINRAEKIEEIERWIIKSKEYGLNVCGHLIFGLPGESQDMMLDSIDFVNRLKVDSIKIHPMYVTKNTALATDYMNKKFYPITQKEYNQVTTTALKKLDPKIIIQRVTAGIDSDMLLSPSWCKNKHNQINTLRKELLKEGLLY
jgi:radical SAM protein (TIGR01212 family)